jgi:hypothetical protein
MEMSDRGSKIIDLSLSLDAVKERLKEVGLTTIDSILKPLVDTYRNNKFANKNSLIPAKKIEKFPLEAFVVDCGGTNTRVQHYVNDENNVETYESSPKGSGPNQSWMNKNEISPEEPIRQYFGNIIDEMIAAAGGDISRVKNVSIVWSNNGECYQLEGETKGVSLKVVGKDDGTDYRKNEPFIKGLKDGDDIGKIFLEEAARRNISLDRLVIGNDTIFVGTAASNEPDAAGVSSSGSNMEAIINGFLTNLECGARIKAEIAACDWEKIDDTTIESFIAGNWYPKRFIKILEGYFMNNDSSGSMLASLNEFTFPMLSVQGKGSIAFSRIFDAVEAILDQGNISISDLEKLKASLGLPPESDLTPDAVNALREITTFVAERAVKLTAVMAAIALSHRVEVAKQEGRPLRLAMDSRVLEGLDRNGLFASTLHELIGDVTIELVPERVLPDGTKTSVPLLGAPLALYLF